jgi:hypothetical protein
MRVMERQTPRAASLAEIERLRIRALADSVSGVCLAGAPAVRTAPNGLADIMRRGGRGHNLGVSGGLTLTKNSAAFTPPRLDTTMRSVRTGTRVEHYARVQRTTSHDATHDCFYPGPGDHLRPGMTQQIGGRTYNHYWRVSPQVSTLLRRGEQEHLDDALRAYQLTYQLIENTINALAAGREFGPATTPFEATRLAQAELARRLPAQLGTNPANWVRVLDRLLTQTRTRDTNGWHALDIDPPQTIGNRIIHPVVTTSTTRIGQVPSSRVVNY